MKRIIFAILIAAILAMGCSEKTTEPKIPTGSVFINGLELIPLKNNTYSVYNYTGSDSLVVIPNSYDGFPVTRIGTEAFTDCSSLTSITIPNSVTSIGWFAFYGCSSLTNVTVDPANTVYRSEGNCLIRSSNNSLIFGCQTSIIPDSVTSIGDVAFGGCSSLTSITIPSSVTSIGYAAFSDCSSLTSVTIPSSVTSIGDKTFQGCSSLTIYAQATSKPTGWHANWNPDNRPVVWGATMP